MLQSPLTAPITAHTDDPIIHVYRWQGREPQPGDKALCGHVKTLPKVPGVVYPVTTCAVCADLEYR